MSRRTKLVAISAGIIAAAGAGGAVAVATSGSDDSERPIAGAALERASDAALEATGGGTVTETEAGDEDSYYEVEVRRDDGTQVDVQVDREFNVVGQADDDESPDDGRE